MKAACGSAAKTRSKRFSTRMIEGLEARVMLSSAAQRAAAEMTAARLDLPSPQLPRQYHLLYPDANRAKGAAAGAPPLQIALEHLRRNASKLGLTTADIVDPLVTDQYSDNDTGITHIYLRQRYRGTEIANADLSVHVMRDGTVLTTAGGFVPDFAGKLGVSLAQTPSLERATPAAGADRALATAARRVGFALSKTPVRISSLRRVARTHPIYRAPEASLDDVKGKLQYVMAGENVRLAWELVMRTPDQQHWYSISVDADDGSTVHGVVDWVSHATAGYNVLPVPVEHPLDGARQPLTDPHDVTVSPYGWHDTDGVEGFEYTDTRGNNVFAQDDIDANNSGGTRPSGGSGSTLTFNSPLDLTQSPSTYRDAAITNLFYWTNLLHDAHARYGFTEVAGNFQVTNYSGQGVGNDALQADAQDGSGYNNANMSSPPDGTSPRMQMYLWNQTSPNRDGDFDNMIIVHEYGHGVSNRLTGGPSNSNALTATQSRAMGEGWSDWWGLIFTLKPTDTMSMSYPVGTYVTNTTAGIRRYPYAFDKAVDPLTYNAIKSSPEEHDAGEIWASALWDMTWLLVDRYGIDSDFQHGYSASDPNRDGGNNLALKLVMDALKLQPANPSFLAGRDAILAADQALSGGQHAGLIWSAFARRGMGYSASDGGSASSINVTEAFDVPTQFQKPRATGVTPASPAIVPIQGIDIAFSEAMNPATFSIAEDVVSFVSPTGQNLLGIVSLPSWNAQNTSLHLSFSTPLATDGNYALTLGPDIRSADDNTPLDQDQDSFAGEPLQDQYVARFTYDALQLSVTSTSPANGSVVTLPITSLELNFNEAVLASSIGINDLVLSRGSVTAATAVDSDTVRYTFSSILGETDLTFTLEAGALTDLNGRPGALFSGVLAIEAGTTAFPATLYAQDPRGSLHFAGSTNTTIGYAGDRDSFTLYLEGGQRLAAWIDPDANLAGRVELFDGQGNSMAMGSSSAVGQDVYLSAVVPSTGTYTVSVTGLNNDTGTMALGVVLNATLEPEARGGAANDTLASAQVVEGAFDSLLPGAASAVLSASLSSSSDVDYYAFNLQAGDHLTLSSNYSNNIVVLDGAGMEVARGYSGASGFRVLADLRAPGAGTYYVKVSGYAGSYNLFLARNATFETLSNNTIANSTPVRLTAVGPSRALVGNVSQGYADFYALGVAAGQALTFTSRTPLDGAGLPDNRLNPRLRLMDASGAVLASDDNSGADGRNAVLSYIPSASGTLYLEVSSVASSPANEGPYVVSAGGLVAMPENFTAVANSPTNGARLNYSFSSVTIDFSDAVWGTSVQAGDLLIDGIPATAVSLTDHNTFVFSIPSNQAAGEHVLSIAAGAITDIHGNALAAFSSTFIVDKVGPRVISSSIQSNQTLPSGTFSYVVTFDEPMRAGAVSSYEADVKGLASGTTYYASSYAWSSDALTLTLTYANLPPDRYTLGLTIPDVANNSLDGETPAYVWPIPSGKSGDGTAGGEFLLTFLVDPAIAAPFPALTLNQLKPANIWEGAAYVDISGVADVDYFTIDLDAGQTLSVVIDRAVSLVPTLEVTGPLGTILGTAQAPEPGADAFVQNIAVDTAGTYTLGIGGAAGTSGTARVQVILNAGLELEARDGAFNNSFETAQVLTLAPDALNRAAGSAAVMGIVDSSTSDYYALDLFAGDSLTVASYGAGSAMKLHDSAGNTIARADPNHIRDIGITSTGRYYLNIGASYGASSYALLVLRNGGIEQWAGSSSTSSASLTMAAPIGNKQYYSGQLSYYYEADFYRIFVRAGTTVALSTATPLDGPLLPTGAFDPRLRLYNASNLKIKEDDNSGADGRNAVLSYTATADEVLFVEVGTSTSSSTGTYVLTIDGATISPKPFSISSMSLSEGGRYSSLSTVTVNFTNSIDLRTVEVGDVTFDGVPVTTVTVNDHDTLIYTIPAGYASGPHTFAVVAGSIQDIYGVANAAYTVNFVVDKDAPHVVGSSLLPNASLPAGNLSYVVSFDEAMSNGIDKTDVLLQGQYAGSSYTASTLTWNTERTMLTIAWTGLIEDRYTLTLTSGSGAFADLAGNYLDGEITSSTWPMPPGMSGNGASGGSFTFGFDLIEEGPAAMPAATAVAWPRGGAVYRSAADGVVSAGDSDLFTIDLDGGQLAGIIVNPNSTLAPMVEFIGPDGRLLRSASAAAGAIAAFQGLAINDAGRYTIRVTGAASSTGRYTVELLLNGVRESENAWSLANDTQDKAMDLNTAFVNLGAGTRQATVLGNGDLLTSKLPVEVEPNNSIAVSNSAVGNFEASTGATYLLSASGSISPSYSESDYYKIGALQAGDVITINGAGSSSYRGSLNAPYIYLLRGSGSWVAGNVGSGTGNDSLIDRFTITSDDTYYVQVTNNDYYSTGSYQLNIILNNVGAAPLGGGNQYTEVEPNSSVSYATDLSSSWRQVNWRSTTTGSVSVGNPDVFSYFFNAGDLVSWGLNINGTSTTLTVFNESGVQVGFDDGSGYPVTSYPMRIAQSGMYYAMVSATGSARSYTLETRLASSFGPPASSTGADWYRMDLEAGERVTLGLESRYAGQMGLSLLDQYGTTLGTGEASELAAHINDLAVSERGRYYVQIVGGSGAPYALTVTRNGLVDVEQVHSLAHPQLVPATARIVGSLAPTPATTRFEDGFEFGVLGAQWATYKTTYGRIWVLNQYTAPGAGGTYALYMDSDSYALNEATLTLDLQAVEQATIAFDHLSFNDTNNAMPSSPFTGHANGDGIAISADGYTWYSVWSPTVSSNNWLHYSIDLAAAARLKGIALNSQFKVKFQQYGYSSMTSGGRGWDNINISAAPPADDYYAVDLEVGDRIEIATATPFDGPKEPGNLLDPKLELIGPDGAVVAWDDNTAPDGRNAKLSWVAALSGRYRVHVGSSLSTGDYVLDLSTRTTTNPPPLRPDLIAASDTGFSNSDDVTRLNNSDPASALTFMVPGTTAGAQVVFYVDGRAVGSAVATGETTQITTDGAWALEDGAHRFTARQTPAGGTASAESPVATIVVATAAALSMGVASVDAASDSGVASDNVTSDNTPTLRIPLGAAPFYRVYRDDVLLSGAFEEADQVTLPPLGDGSWSIYLVAVDLAGNESPRSTAMNLLIDTVAPAAPAGGLDLRATSDTGISDSDNLTSDATPTFTVPARGAGSVGYRVYRNAVLVSGLFETANFFTSPQTGDGAWVYTFVSVDLAGNQSVAAPALNVVIDSAAPTAPQAAVRLAPGADQGLSSSDNLTTARPVFDVSLPETGWYRVYRDGVLISGLYESGATFVASDQPGGSHVYTCTTIDASGNQSQTGPALILTIDALAPTAQLLPLPAWAGPHEVLISFSEDVSWSLSASDLVIRPVGGGASFSPDTLIYDPATRTARFTFRTLPSDGNYIASLDAASADDAAGNGLASGITTEIYVLAGDANRDRRVDFFDLTALAAFYGSTGATWANGDFNGDGAVNFFDLTALAAVYGKALAAPGA